MFKHNWNLLFGFGPIPNICGNLLLLSSYSHLFQLYPDCLQYQPSTNVMVSNNVIHKTLLHLASPWFVLQVFPFINSTIASTSTLLAFTPYIQPNPNPANKIITLYGGDLDNLVTCFYTTYELTEEIETSISTHHCMNICNMAYLYIYLDHSIVDLLCGSLSS